MLATVRARFPLLVDSGYATLTAGSAALLLVLLTIAGRFLSAADYGRFSFALALTTILETIMDSGLSQVTVRAVARDKTTAGHLFRHVLGLKLVWIAIGLAVLAVLAPLLRSDPTVIKLCYAMGISSAVRSYLLTARGLLQGLERFDLEALTVVADRLLLLLAGGVALWAGYGLYGLAAAFVISRLTMLGVVQIILRFVVDSTRPSFDRAMWRDLQAVALPLGFFMLALNTYSYIDTVILGVMRTNDEVGWYAASYRVYEGLTYAPSILAAVLTPRLSALFTHDRSAHRRLLTRALLAMLALGVLLGGTAALAARPIILLLFGERYVSGVLPLQILSGGALFVFTTWILHAAAISINLDRRLLLTTAIGLTANVLLNIVFIPRWGISGAAWATVLAEMLTVLLLLAQVARRLQAEWSPSGADRRLLWILGLALFISYAYFYQAGGWNQNSRFALVRAILERHSLQIDAYHEATGDRAVWNGHYYSDKAPGASLVAVIPADLARAVGLVLGVAPESDVGIAWTSYVATVAASGLFTVLAALCVFWLSVSWGFSPGAALFASTAYGVATPAWCYATLFMGHGLSAGCLMLAFAASLALPRASEKQATRLAWVIGASGGWAVVSDFPSAVPLLFIVALTFFAAGRGVPANWRHVAVGIVGGGSVTAFVLLGYNTAAFGSPFHLGYASEEGFEQLHSGLFGITHPQWWRVQRILVGSYRGLLPISPLMAVTPVGLIALARKTRQTRPALVAGAIAVFYLALNASYFYWEGGWIFGPRQMAPALPFLSLGLAPLWDRWRGIVRALLVGAWAWGAALTLVAVSTTPQPPASIERPLTELMLPAFREGALGLNNQRFTDFRGDETAIRRHTSSGVSWNLGMKMGLTGLLSLIPLGLFWLCTGWWLSVVAAAWKGASPRPESTGSSPAARGSA